MDSVKSSTFLSNLIGTGPDAGSNLFQVTIRNQGSTDYDGELSFRAYKFTSPKRDLGTVDLPYRNTVVTKVSRGTDIDKSFKLTIRMDDRYALMDFLRDRQGLDAFGNVIEGDDTRFEVSVVALTPTGSGDAYKKVYSWSFYDCRIQKLSSIAYDYSNAGAVSVTVDFVFSYSTETSLDREVGSSEAADSRSVSSDQTNSRRGALVGMSPNSVAD